MADIAARIDALGAKVDALGAKVDALAERCRDGDEPSRHDDDDRAEKE